MSEKILVIFSGGQDSTTCLLQAIATCGAPQVEAITFCYGQRHTIELECARRIAADLQVRQTVLDIPQLQAVTHNALMDENAAITQGDDGLPSTFVDGRNALFLLYAAIYAKGRGIRRIMIGVSEADFSGYPDCRDIFIKSMNVSLNLAMAYDFRIETPLMNLKKAEVWALADQLGRLDYVREYSHSCYRGVRGGCGTCPACELRERGWREYQALRQARG